MAITKQNVRRNAFVINILYGSTFVSIGHPSSSFEEALNG